MAESEMESTEAFLFRFLPDYSFLLFSAIVIVSYNPNIQITQIILFIILHNMSMKLPLPQQFFPLTFSEKPLLCSEQISLSLSVMFVAHQAMFYVWIWRRTNGSIFNLFFPSTTGIPYKSNGYASEPDANYDSDYALKYHTVDRKRTTSTGNQNDEKWVDDWVLKSTQNIVMLQCLLFLFVSRLGSYELPVKQTTAQYKNQPGKIEHYTPGKSSVSDKEAKQVTSDDKAFESLVDFPLQTAKLRTIRECWWVTNHSFTFHCPQGINYYL